MDNTCGPVIRKYLPNTYRHTLGESKGACVDASEGADGDAISTLPSADFNMINKTGPLIAPCNGQLVVTMPGWQSQ